VGYTPRVLAKIEINIMIYYGHDKIIDLYDLYKDKIGCVAKSHDGSYDGKC